MVKTSKATGEIKLIQGYKTVPQIIRREEVDTSIWTIGVRIYQKKSYGCVISI